MPERDPRPSEHRSADLRRAKLRGLVRAHAGAEIVIDDHQTIVGGVVGVEADRRVGYVLARPDDPERGLGPALIWADRNDIDGLRLIVDDPDLAGHVARRAALVEFDVEVLRAEGRELVAVEPSPHRPVPELPADEWALASLISEAGGRPVDDHGRLVAEVAGLEVARVERSTDDAPVLAVGVGQADRELHSYVHHEMAPDTALRRAIAEVASRRRPSQGRHPLARMARERWMRSTLVDDPAAVGAASLEPLAPLRPRATVLGNVPSAAAGRDRDGEPMVVVCSAGIDPDLVPEAADYRNRHDPAARLLVVVPERDRHPVTERLVELVARAELRSLPAPWL